MSRTARAPVANSAALAAAVVCLGTAAHAAQPGDQIIVKDLIAAKGWTSIVPMNLNGDGPDGHAVLQREDRPGRLLGRRQPAGHADDHQGPEGRQGVDRGSSRCT
jgi:hypothetical protein